jgi:hypothetical protein
LRCWKQKSTGGSPPGNKKNSLAKSAKSAKEEKSQIRISLLGGLGVSYGFVTALIGRRLDQCRGEGTLAFI